MAGLVPAIHANPLNDQARLGVDARHKAGHDARFGKDRKMNPYLDQDLLALGDQARRFAADRIAPGFQERDRTRTLDRALMKEMGAMGFIAPELPEQFGELVVRELANGGGAGPGQCDGRCGAGAGSR